MLALMQLNWLTVEYPKSDKNNADHESKNSLLGKNFIKSKAMTKKKKLCTNFYFYFNNSFIFFITKLYFF